MLLLFVLAPWILVNVFTSALLPFWAQNRSSMSARRI
jgi:hypothetical protein